MTTDTITYSYSCDEELFKGHFATPEAAAAAGFSDDDYYEGTVWVGENLPTQTSRYVSAYRILEDVHSEACDECTEAADDWLLSLQRDPQKRQELEKLVADWIDANDPPRFWRVETCREYHRADIVAAGLLQGEA